MTPDRKHPTAAFWITVALVALLVAYPLSAGPVTWIDDRYTLPIWTGPAIETVYSPLVWLSRASKPFSDAYGWYVALWMAESEWPPPV